MLLRAWEDGQAVECFRSGKLGVPHAPLEVQSRVLWTVAHIAFLRAELGWGKYVRVNSSTCARTGPRERDTDQHSTTL